MATIADLPIPDFSKMSDDQLLALIKDVRARRRNPEPEVKAAAQKKVQAKVKKGKAVALKSVDSLLEGVSKEDAAKLLAMLREGKK